MGVGNTERENEGFDLAVLHWGSPECASAEAVPLGLALLVHPTLGRSLLNSHKDVAQQMPTLPLFPHCKHHTSMSKNILRKLWKIFTGVVF